MCVYSCFQPSFCSLSASFCRIFLDIARYACKISNENTLNIKQKYRLNSNDRFGFKPQFFVKTNIHRIFIYYTSNRDLSA